MGPGQSVGVAVEIDSDSFLRDFRRLGKERFIVDQRTREGRFDRHPGDARGEQPQKSAARNRRIGTAGVCRFVVSGSTIGLLSDLPSLSNRQLPSFASGALAM